VGKYRENADIMNRTGNFRLFLEFIESTQYFLGVFLEFIESTQYFLGVFLVICVVFVFSYYFVVFDFTNNIEV
jgi:hypothetical protein